MYLNPFTISGIGPLKLQPKIYFMIQSNCWFIVYFAHACVYFCVFVAVFYSILISYNFMLLIMEKFLN